MQSASQTPLTSEPAEENDSALIRQVNRELAVRARTGCWSYLAIAVAVWLATDLPSRDRDLLIAVTIATGILTGARLWLLKSEWWFGAAGPVVWRHLLGSVLVASGAVWGGMLAYVVATRDMASATTSLMIALLVGLVSGTIHVAAPILKLTALYLIVVVTPVAVSGAWVGHAAGWAFAGINVVFFYIFLALAKSIHREYWEHLSARRLLEVRAEQIGAARDAAEAAGRAKLEFLANVSHELRTPMNGIIGMSSLALATQLNEEQRDLIQTAKDSADSLLTLLNDLLDFSKMDSGKMLISPMPTELRPFLELALKQFRTQAEGKGVRLLLSVEPAFPVAIEADPVRLRQVVINLVSNALKFTSQGRVELRASYDELASIAYFSVADTGIGIPADKQQAIFEAFTQADGSVTRRFGGTGLGLAICTKLVNIWGGEIGVESEPGLGSRFHFSLPAKACERPMNEPEVAEMLMPARISTSDGTSGDADAGLRILVAEDNLVNQKVAQRMLEKMGHSVRVAANGRIAVDMRFSEEFDLILMDVQMPEMSGLEATVEIRRREAATNSRIPIVAITANAMTGDRERCLEAGMDGYLSKPIRVEELRSMTTNLASLSQPV